MQFLYAANAVTEETASFMSLENREGEAGDDTEVRTPAEPEAECNTQSLNMMLKCSRLGVFFLEENKMEKIFHLKESGTNVKRELNAGLTTFFAMAYIIFLNPVFLSETGMDRDGVLIATCLSAAAGTLLCAFLSNLPFAMASGMGMNAFFTYTLCGAFGYTWQQALALTFIAGLLFFAASVSPLRDKIINAVPLNLKHAITAGIGLFITLIGLLDSGIATMASGFPAIGDLSDKTVLTALFGLLITVVLTVLKVRGSFIIGMIFSVILSLALGLTALPEQLISFPGAIGNVFMKMDFSGLLRGGSGLAAFSALSAVILSMALVDMFDTLGFIIGTCSGSGMLDEKGNFGKMGKVLVADSAATVIGAVCGTSTVTCYAESATGISAGGRTGLTSVATAGCFLLAMFFAPLSGAVTAAATAPALIIVGMYLLMDIKKVDFSSLDDAIPAFLTVAAIPMTYSITTGIAVGFISHVVCKLAARRFKELSVAMVILAAVFVLYLCI